MMRFRTTLAQLVTVLVIAAPSLGAQVSLNPVTPRLQKVVQLAQEGYGDSARAVISGILARTAAGDPSLPEALYTAATVAKTGDSTIRLLKRVSVEFPASPWADKSQLRLALLSFGNGDMDDVVSRVTRLFTDYPDSPVLPTASLWGARAAFEQQKVQQGCDWLTRGIAHVGDDIELRNQLLFTKQRCNVGEGVKLAPVVPESLKQGPPPRTDTGKRAAAPPPAPPPPPPPATRANSPWRVQVAAISDNAVIRRLSQQIETAGFKVYLVPGPRGLTKVQAGPFATRADATAKLARIRSVAGKAAFVTPAP